MRELYKTGFEGAMSERPISCEALSRCRLRAAGQCGLAVGRAPPGKSQSLPEPWFPHLHVKDNNKLRAVIKVKEIFVCQLEFHILGSQHLPPLPDSCGYVHLSCLFLQTPFSLLFSSHSHFAEWSSGKQSATWDTEIGSGGIQRAVSSRCCQYVSFQKSQCNFWLC